MRRIGQSGHEVFGFSIAQKVDDALDPFLSVEELFALMQDTPAQVEIVETTVLEGFIDVIATTFNVEDTTIDFDEAGVGLGYLLELKEGDNAGVYFIESSSGSTLVLSRPPDGSSHGFVGNETGIPYRLFTQQLKISSTTAGPGSSIEIVTAPTQLGLPTGIVYGTVPAVEAVNADGDLLDLSVLLPGDESDGLVIESVSEDGTQATIVGGVSAGLVNLRFAFDGRSEGLLRAMIDNLTTIKSSRNLLKKFNFDKSIDQIDLAMTSLITPGQAFRANLNQARVVVAHLVAVLAENPISESQYTATIPDVALHVDSSITPYDAPRVPALDALLDSLNEHGFDRALALMITGRIRDFFDTTAATASFAGALLEAARAVAGDVPDTSTLQSDVEEEINNADGFQTVPDSAVDFSDTEGETQDAI
jgi:hypothetical protein